MTATGFDSDNLTSKPEDKVNASDWSSISNENVLGINDKFINTPIQLYKKPVSGTSFPDIDSYSNSSLPSSAIYVSNVTGQDMNSTIDSYSNSSLPSSAIYVSNVTGQDTNSTIDSYSNSSLPSSAIYVSNVTGQDTNSTIDSYSNSSLPSSAIYVSNVTGQDTNSTIDSYSNSSLPSSAIYVSNVTGQDMNITIDSYSNSSLPSSAISVFNVTGQDMNSTSSDWILSSSRTNISGADVEDISIQLVMSSGISVSSRNATSKNVNTSLISPELSASSTAEEDIKNNFVNTTVISGGTSISSIAGQDSYNVSKKSMLISWNTSPASFMSGMKIDDTKSNHVNSSLTINSTSLSGAFDLSNISTDSSASPSGRSESGVMPGSVAIVHDVNISKDFPIGLRNASTSDTTAQDINTISANSSLTSLPGTLITTTGARDTNDRIVGSSSESSKVANEDTISFISHVGVSEASFPFGGISFLNGSFSGIDSLNGLVAGIPQAGGVIGAGITSVDDVIPDTSFVYDKGMGGKMSRVNAPKDTSKENGNNLSNATFISVN